MSRERLRPRPALRQIIYAKGDEVTVVPVRGWIVALAAVTAIGVAFWLTATTAYIFFRDDVFAAMMARQTRMQHAYEDRIAALRLQVDRITSRQLLDQDAFTARMEELIRRQATLDGRAQAVQGLIERAQRSGVVPPVTNGPRAQVAPTAADPIVTGSLGALRGESQQRGARIGDTLERVEIALQRSNTLHETAFGKIEERLREQETRIRVAVSELGLSTERIAGRRPVARAGPAPESGLGGPFVPLPTGRPSTLGAFEIRTAYLHDQIDYLDRLRQGLAAIPLRRPVRGEPDVSSGFGPRRDPFLGVMAMHQGIDFRGSTGDPVHASGAGTVTQAARSGGFGNMVEIDHGHGLFTRYAHLSVISVREGQTVTSGQLIGRVGSTGRSTGPHLHFETWMNDQAVNPDRFVRVGQRLGLW